MIPVTLTQAEELTAARVGFARAESYKTGEVTHRPGYNYSDRYQTYFEVINANMIATGAEIAVARVLGLSEFDPTINGFKERADIGRNIEVKYTTWLSGHLIVQPSDRDDDVAILCVGTAPDYKVVGYIPISAAKKPRFLHKSGSYWISQINLRPIETLTKSIYANVSI
jgi:hypothetical protein